MPIRTYIDSGVLICAARAEDKLSQIALAYLSDPLREYVTSDYVKVELLPKCTFHKRAEERAFYDAFFSTSVLHVPSSPDLAALAIDTGGRTGISGLDALHVACAIVGSADELITAEKPSKPIHRADGLKVISIRPDEQSTSSDAAQSGSA